jgi:pantoate--beta-alanine ligase
MALPAGFRGYKTLKMIIFKKSADLVAYLKNQRKSGHGTGFVPTMGALHAGHISLIKASLAATDLTICSIFVNPRQFNDPRDLEKYPVTIEEDILLLEKQGTDILFLPSVEEIYPPGEIAEKYAPEELEEILEGKYRPGHFQGVLQVMNRLLKKVGPDHLFMGQKDFQQCLVVKQLISRMKFPVQFHMVPTCREPDGLAMSSRNQRLNPEQREKAAVIWQTLQYIKEHLKAGNPAPVLETAHHKLDAAGFKTDYVALGRVSNLQPVETWNGKDKIIALIAAYQGEVRLIDNLLLN